MAYTGLLKRYRLYFDDRSHGKAFENVFVFISGLYRLSLDQCFRLFGYLQFDKHQSGFIAPLPTDVLADLDAIDQYDVIRNVESLSVLSIFPLPGSSEIDWDKYVGAEHPFLGYDVFSDNVSSLLLSRVARRLRSCAEEVFSVSGRDVVWLFGLAYTSMERLQDN